MTPGRTNTLQTVLVVGATGMLGGRIAHHLLRQPSTSVRLLVRPGGRTGDERARRLESLRQRGADIFEGTLADHPGLDAATRGVDVVVCAVQGGPGVMVDGQVALAKAAALNGARRILPSDFGPDLFKATPGDNAWFDLKREADEAIAGTGLEHVHVLSGVFMDGLLGPHGGLFDHDDRTLAHWGTGQEPFPATSVDDTARYASTAAVDPALRSGKFSVAAEQLTLDRAAHAVESASGRKYTRTSLGTVDDLRDRIEQARAAGATPRHVVTEVYLLSMLSGQTALDDLQNDRYPDIRPRQFTEMAQMALGDGKPPAGSAAAG